MKDRIRAILEMAGINQATLAERVGIQQSAVSMWLSGKREPTESTKKLICSEFGISREWLETGEGEMKAPDPTAAQMVLRVMRGQNEYAKQVMAAFATLDDSEWEALKEIVDKLKKAGL